MDVDLDAVDLTDLDRFARGFPHDVFTALRRESPVWWHEPTEHTPGGEGFWVVSRHGDVVAAAGDAATYSSHRGGGREGGGTLIEDLPTGFAAGVLLNMTDGPRHHAIRKVVTPAVSPRAIARLESDLASRTTAIVDAAVSAGGCDFVVDVAAELPLQAIALLMGVPQEDRHRLFEWANVTLDYRDRDLGEDSDAAQHAATEMLAYGAALVAAKRRDPGDDILSAMAGAEVDGEPLDDLTLQMFFSLLIAAGSETTRNTLAHAVLALAGAHEWELLRRDRSLLPRAVEEMLRWASSTAYNRRTATVDTELGGERIRAGDKVTLWWASANRDEEVFADPFRFDIGREPNKHVAFGHGPHFCLGANLARLEIRLVFEALLDRVPTVAVAGDVEWMRSNKHIGIRHLPVAFG
ncbi:MAG: cytochrome P450 [Acidimicrobiia bacterium]|nr:cytochrome P450 [Acidimicrobiia bacterium]